MNKQQQQKVVQYLNEAHGSELALVRQLQAQIAMTPRGQYRDGLETHLDETRRHAERLEGRLGELGQGNNPLQVGLGAVQSAIGQVFALTKTPLDLVRGSSGEEKVLKNAKDSCAAEALEIATYTALARLARTAGDATTERLAKSILGDEQKMLDRLLREIPRLTDAVARAEFDGEGSFEVTETGAADAARKGARTAKRTARQGAGQAKRTARQARKVPGVARAEGTVKGAVASASDLAVPNYDSLSADEVQEKLAELSQIQPSRRTSSWPNQVGCGCG
jgi:ferritin-like metal-binding protein YciE